MAVTATRSTTITYTGDVTGTETIAASSNAASPGSVEIKTLASGANTITPPTGGTTAKAVTIVPPAANAQTITLKGVTGDTGFLLSPTEPTTLALASGTTTFVLTCGAEIAGVRFFWT
jgi:hypothetical protein